MMDSDFYTTSPPTLGYVQFLLLDEISLTQSVTIGPANHWITTTCPYQQL